LQANAGQRGVWVKKWLGVAAKRQGAGMGGMRGLEKGLKDVCIDI